MNINKLVKLKDNKYKIILDSDIIITYDNVILDNGLLYKKNIDKNLYNKIQKDTHYYDIYNKVVKYIMKKCRSEKEVRIYIEKFDITEQEIEDIIKKLKDLKLINDLEYCKTFINDKVYLSKNGINKIKYDLLNQDIPLNIIEQELKNIDETIINERLEKIILKKINNNKKYSNQLLKQKILNEMIMLGYDKNKILKMIDDNLNNNESILEKEYNKIYSKLKLKYEGFELKNKILQKLLSKGFTVDEINNIIKKTEE